MLMLFVPGPIELIIVATVVLVPVLVVLAVVYAVTARKRADAENPNLMVCPDCKHYVSIHADSCPKCGCPIHEA